MTAAAAARPWALGLLLSVAMGLVGCERQMQDMYRQPRYEPGAGSRLWPDGRAGRAPPSGTVVAAAGDLAATSSARRGRDLPEQWRAAGEAEATPEVSRTLLLRGQERYAIYCAPCHGALGDGQGPVARHGFPRPPSYHQPRLRDVPDRYLFDVITHGHGVMYAYADRVDAQDRWAIVAYLRALQLSQSVPAADLPPALRDKVLAGGGR